MFRSLRNRLILSHILPLIVVSLLTGTALIYVLETRFLLPRLADNLVGDARLLAEISRSEYELWGNPVLFGRMLDRVGLDPAALMRVGFQISFAGAMGLTVMASGIEARLARACRWMPRPVKACKT